MPNDGNAIPLATAAANVPPPGGRAWPSIRRHLAALLDDLDDLKIGPGHPEYDDVWFPDGPELAEQLRRLSLVGRQVVEQGDYWVADNHAGAVRLATRR